MIPITVPLTVNEPKPISLIVKSNQISIPMKPVPMVQRISFNK